MNEMLLDELSDLSEPVRQAAIDRTAALPPEALEEVLCIYFQRREDYVNAVWTARKQSPYLRWLGPFKKPFKSNIASQPTPTSRMVEFILADQSLAKVIAKIETVEYLGVFTYALTRSIATSPHQNLDSACVAAISRIQHLLPSLEPEHAAQLPNKARAILLYPLQIVKYNYPRNDGYNHNWAVFPAFRRSEYFQMRTNLRQVREPALKALKLLEHIGDERDLELVRHLANIKPRTIIAREIQEAAQKSMPFVAVRAQRNLDAKRLLRPSDAIAAAIPNTLLRPATDNTETDANELLRPSTSAI